MQVKPDLSFLNGWRLAMGLQPLHLAEWIDIDADFVDQLALKHQLLSDRPVEVFASLSGSQAAQQEVLDHLIEHLLTYFPQHYQKQGHTIANLSTHQRWNLPEFTDQPLNLASRLVQEDLCLLLPGAEGYVLAAASVCFPSRWSLAEKIGAPLAQIHAPVPGYSDRLQHPVDHLFARLKPDYPGVRFNWSITDSPQLFLPPSVASVSAQVPITIENAGHRLWLRVERQTLRRFGIHNSVLFTIRTYIYSIASLIDDHAIAANLLTAIQQMPEPMQDYKSLLSIRSVLLEYLALHIQQQVNQR